MSIFYLAQNQTDAIAKTHGLFKAGRTRRDPSFRMKEIAGIASTSMFRTLVQLPLPVGISDTAVLNFPLMRPNCLSLRSGNAALRDTYINLFGKGNRKRTRKVLDSRLEMILLGKNYKLADITKKLQQTVQELTEIRRDPLRYAQSNINLATVSVGSWWIVRPATDWKRNDAPFWLAKVRQVVPTVKVQYFNAVADPYTGIYQSDTLPRTAMKDLPTLHEGRGLQQRVLVRNHGGRCSIRKDQLPMVRHIVTSFWTKQ
jgi:hypothetical protein